ncbi:MAG: hypothetical protein JSV31_27085 [Desulfobacterales bacterium]|nr:MAG: hypothetical protein JSV31_27085 [Desulfobacterales bacterium]
MTFYEYNENWTEEKIGDIEIQLLHGVFQCRTTEAVEAAITYANFLSTVGITPENCALFLKILEIENHWVIDALIGERDPFLLLSAVQPNAYIVNRIFGMMTKWHKGGIYSKNLSVILGVLQSVYSSPRDGYRIYPLTIANLNAMGKHLDKEKGQDDPLNRIILEIMDKISDLEDSGNADMEEIAIHASNIRNAFFDNRKKMEDVIPPVLLVTIDGRKEITPRKREKVTADQKRPRPETTVSESKTAAAPPQEKKEPSAPPKAERPPAAPTSGAPAGAQTTTKG